MFLEKNWKMIVAMMQTGSVIWGLSSLLHRRIIPWCTARWQTYCRSWCRRYDHLTSSVWWLLDSLVHHALRLRIGTSKTFWMQQSIWDVPRVEIDILTHAHVERYETSDKYFTYKMEGNGSASEHVLRLCGYYNHLNQVGVNLPAKIVIDRVL